MRHSAIVAVVDDDPSVRKALSRLMRAAGMEARGYPSAEAFLDALVDGEPDCALVDVQMPGVSGLTLLDRLRRRGSQLPVIFLTARDSDEVRAQALRGGARACFAKPLGDLPLLAAITGALG